MSEASPTQPKKRGPPKGSIRYGGRAKGVKNRATVERELKAAAEAAAIQGEGRELAKDVLARMMKLAEGVAGLHRPPSPIEVDAAEAEGKAIPEGDWDRFGQWFDRVAYCAKELARYQSPQIKAVDAPTPPPDPKDLERSSRKRFGLRVFEGGKPLLPPSESA